MIAGEWPLVIIPAMTTGARLTRELLLEIASAVLRARHVRRWSQRRLAAACSLSQSMVSAIERARVPDLPISTAIRVLDALDVRVDLRLIAPTAAAPPVRDRVRARCVAYVARQLERRGWLVATEVAEGDARWRGFIDVLAFHPTARLLLVIEVKVELDDIGATDRQLGTYERFSWSAAHDLGWRPRAATGVLLLLSTDDGDRRLIQHRSYVDRLLPLRWRRLGQLVADPDRPPPRGERGLAMIDSRTRRAHWLLPTWLDGRRTPARYPDRAAYVAA
jgi:transcriptional regulator with XRE-family HTH domain